jgi:hypothetical protein
VHKFQYTSNTSSQNRRKSSRKTTTASHIRDCAADQCYHDIRSYLIL